MSRSIAIQVGREARNHTRSPSDNAGMRDSAATTYTPGGGGGTPTGTPWASLAPHTHGLQNFNGTVVFPVGTTQWATDFLRPDFLSPSGKGAVFGDFSPNCNVVGYGPDVTFIEVVPNSMSTLTQGKVPSQSAGGVNPIKMLRLDNGYFQDLTFKASDQQKQYGGPILYQGEDRRMTRVNARGFRGDNAGPPGETFSLQVWQAHNFTFEDCHVSGLGYGANASTKVSATGFGLDSCTGTMLVKNCSSTDCKYFGMAPYDLGPGTLRFENVDIRRNGYCGLNFERCHDMTVEIVNCDFRDQGPANQWVMKFGSDKGGSCVINIRDPKWNSTSDGKFHVKSRLASLGGYTGGIQTQRREDVHLFIDGVQRDNLLYWHN